MTGFVRRQNSVPAQTHSVVSLDFPKLTGSAPASLPGLGNTGNHRHLRSQNIPQMFPLPLARIVRVLARRRLDPGRVRLWRTPNLPRSDSLLADIPRTAKTRIRSCKTFCAQPDCQPHHRHRPRRAAKVGHGRGERVTAFGNGFHTVQDAAECASGLITFIARYLAADSGGWPQDPLDRLTAGEVFQDRRTKQTPPSHKP